MKIPDVDFNKLTVQFIKNNSISVLLKVQTIDITFDFKVQTEFYSNANKGNATFSNVNLILIQKLYSLKNSASTAERTVNGLGILIESIVINDFQIDIQFEGGSNLEKLISFAVYNLNQNLKEKLKSI